MPTDHLPVVGWSVSLSSFRRGTSEPAASRRRLGCVAFAALLRWLVSPTRRPSTNPHVVPTPNREDPKEKNMDANDRNQGEYYFIRVNVTDVPGRRFLIRVIFSSREEAEASLKAEYARHEVYGYTHEVIHVSEVTQQELDLTIRLIRRERPAAGRYPVSGILGRSRSHPHGSHYDGDLRCGVRCASTGSRSRRNPPALRHSRCRSQSAVRSVELGGRP